MSRTKLLDERLSAAKHATRSAVVRLGHRPILDPRRPKGKRPVSQGA